MKCPKCGTTLVKKSYKGMMEVDCCPNCRGMWLDFDELDRLEDVVFDDDLHKGSLIHRETETEYFCPCRRNIFQCSCPARTAGENPIRRRRDEAH